MSTEQTAAATATPQHAQASALDATLAATPDLQRDASLVLGLMKADVYRVLRQVWKTSKGQPDLTDAEMYIGMALIARYRLDPFARQIYVTRGKHGVFAIVSVDGWIQILDRTEGYDGFEEEWHFRDEEQKDLVWIETKIFSKRFSRPIVYRAYRFEYETQGGFVSKTMPWHMLRHFALRHCARRFTPLGGNVVTEDEAKWMGAQPSQESDTPTSLDDLSSQLEDDTLGADQDATHGSANDPEQARQDVASAVGAKNCAAAADREPEPDPEPPAKQTRRMSQTHRIAEYSRRIGEADRAGALEVETEYMADEDLTEGAKTQLARTLRKRLEALPAPE